MSFALVLDPIHVDQRLSLIVIHNIALSIALCAILSWFSVRYFRLMLFFSRSLKLAVHRTLVNSDGLTIYFRVIEFCPIPKLIDPA